MAYSMVKALPQKACTVMIKASSTSQLLFVELEEVGHIRVFSKLFSLMHLFVNGIWRWIFVMVASAFYIYYA